MITEDQLEQLCLTWFQAIGYDTISGYDIAPDATTPERSDYRQIILHEDVTCPPPPAPAVATATSWWRNCRACWTPPPA